MKMGLWRAENVDLGLNLGGKSPSTDHLAQHCGVGGGHGLCFSHVESTTMPLSYGEQTIIVIKAVNI